MVQYERESFKQLNSAMELRTLCVYVRFEYEHHIVWMMKKYIMHLADLV